MTPPPKRYKAKPPLPAESPSKSITERGLTQGVLQATASRLEQAHSLLGGIIETTTDLIAAVDTDFRYLAMNEAYHRECQAIYGVDPHVGDSMLKMLAPYPEDLKNAMEAFSAAFQGKSVVTTQIYGDPGKSRRFYELHISPVRDSQGRIIGAAHINTEITERKVREANLAFLAEIGRDFSLLSSADEIMEKVGAKIGAFLNVDSCDFCEVNAERDEIKVVFGWRLDGAPDFVKTFRLSDHYSSDFIRSSKKGEVAVIRDTQTDPRIDARSHALLNIYSFLSVPFLRGNKWENTLSVTCSRPRDWRQDEIELFRELANRIFPRVEKARAEEASRESEFNLAKANRQKEDILESISDCFYALDRDLRFTYINKAAEKIWGLSRADVIGRKVEDIFPDLIDISLSKFKQVLDEQIPQNYQVFSKVIQRWGEMNVYPSQEGISVYFRDITKRKRMEEALRESEAEARALIEYAPTGICEIDYRGPSFVSVNEAMCQVLGYTREELLSIGPSALVDEEDQARYADRVRRQLAGEKIDESVEYRIRKKDGSLIDAILNISFNHTVNDPYRAMIIVHDITERKWAEAALRESEAKFRVIADSIPHLVWTVGPDRKVDYVNSFYREYSGLKPETASEMYTLIHPDDLRICKEAWKYSARTGAVYEVEQRCRRHDGTYHWFLTRGIPIRDDSGKIVKWYGTATDIDELRGLQHELESKVKERTALLRETNKALLAEMDERRRMSEQLRKSEENYRLLFENNLAGVFSYTLDPATLDLRHFSYNEAYARILGYSSLDELLGSNVLSLFSVQADGHQFVQRLMAREKIGNLELCLHRKDRTHAWVIVNATIRKMEGTDLMLVEGTMVDITHRKAVEEQMRAAHRKLRAMASEMIRTEEKERRHIATVLHDTVAQTLAAAKMRFESVQEYVPAEGQSRMDETRKFLTQSIQQTRSIMAELSPPVLYEIGFIPALEWLAERFTDQYGIPVKFDSTDDLQPLTHDIEILFYQATRELLMNVVKHAKANAASVTVSGGDGRLKIEVSDDGVGIDKSQMGPHKDLSGGFGLFSIRERLKHFGGDLDIQSQKDHGTRITISARYNKGTPDQGTKRRKKSRVPIPSG